MNNKDEKPLIYDVYCGAGGVTAGYQQAGFRVVGVDYKPFKRYCGESLIVSDAMKFLCDYRRGKYPKAVGIHCSPPCQKFTAMRHMPNAKEHEDLLTPTRKLLAKIGLPYVIENVEGAPMIEERTITLCGTMFGLGVGDAELRRHRLFESNWGLYIPWGMSCWHGRSRTISVHDDHGRAHDSAANHRRVQRNRTITVFGREAEDRRRRLVLGCGRKRPSTVGVWGNAGGYSERDEVYQFSSAERNEAMGIDWMVGAEISQAIPPAYTKFIGLQWLRHLRGQRSPESRVGASR